MEHFSKKYKTGLVLSGGAVRGIAHLGVLRAIEEKEIPIDIIAGASAGALAGAFIAEGYRSEEILDIFLRRKIFEIVRISVPRTGLLKVEGLKKILKSQLKSKNIEDLPKPLIISATNFCEGRVEYFSKGPLVEALIASAAFPIIFETAKIGNTAYIDGGIMDNLPINTIRDKCKKVIAVYANPTGKIDPPKNLIQITERAFHLAIASEIIHKKAMADVFIEPLKLKKYGLLELRKAHEIYQIGYEAAISELASFI
jgi:NTE family protein